VISKRQLREGFGLPGDGSDREVVIAIASQAGWDSPSEEVTFGFLDAVLDSVLIVLASEGPDFTWECSEICQFALNQEEPLEPFFEGGTEDTILADLGLSEAEEGLPGQARLWVYKSLPKLDRAGLIRINADERLE